MHINFLKILLNSLFEDNYYIYYYYVFYYFLVKFPCVHSYFFRFITVNFPYLRNISSFLFTPISVFILFISKKFAGLFGVKDLALNREVTAEEIMSMVDVAEQKGDIQQEESQMISQMA